MIYLCGLGEGFWWGSTCDDVVGNAKIERQRVACQSCEVSGQERARSDEFEVKVKG